MELSLPFGQYLFPVEDDAEFLLDSYDELEALFVRTEGKVKCCLNDGGLQIEWIRVGDTVETILFIVPYLDGRFAKELTVRMDCEDHIQVWRSIVDQLLTHALDRDTK